MKTIPKLRELGKRERDRILKDNPGLLARVAEACGKTPETVSRVYHGKIDRSPEVLAELDRRVAEILEREAAQNAA
jgi:hypothetical protein